MRGAQRLAPSPRRATFGQSRHHEHETRQARPPFPQARPCRLESGPQIGPVMTSLLRHASASSAPRATLLIRLMVGVVFVSEGLQKFVHPDELGAGRFARIGIPWPSALGPFVGAVEISCGLLVLIGLLTRFAAVPLVATMLVALVSTKLPILLGYGFWGFSLRKLSSYGLGSMLHESRTDLSMLLGSAFLFTVGAGPWSLDARLFRKRSARANDPP